MNNIIIDIETAPKPLAELEALGLVPDIEADKRLKDEAKIKQDIEDKKAAWYDKAALSAVTGHIIMVGFMSGDYAAIGCCCDKPAKPVEGADVLYFDTEAELLQWSMRTVGDRFGGDLTRLIGHNIKLFDMPFMLRRCWVSGLSWCGPTMNGRYWSDRVVDTMEIWGCGEYGMRISLDNLSKLLGVGSKSNDYEDFLPYKDWPKSLDKSCKYLLNDLRLTQACYERMTK